jgi:hypothetical protein
MRRRIQQVAVLVLLAAYSACGGGDDGGNGNPAGPTPPGGGGPSGATITITSNGVSPANVTITTGQVVTVVNNDSRAHDFSSDPHPQHTDCPPINSVGPINPGETQDTGVFSAARTCGFHDHNDPLNTRLQGTITIR